VDLRVQFPKMGFPDSKSVIQDMFEKRNFNETQKQVKCKVLINFDEIKEMTMEELVASLKDLDEGEFSEHYVPVSFHTENLTSEIREIAISEEDEFSKFLTYLYYMYRKIEFKMEKAAYPHILPDQDSQEKPFIRVCVDLGKAKEAYKSMDRDNLLEMYPVLKRLFFCYTDYIKHLMDNVNNIDEGNYLPGDIDEMKPWLRKLNTWIPKNIDGEWHNCMDSVIIVPPEYDHVVETLHRTSKYRNCEVISDDGIDEPHIRTENNETILFGFADMEGTEQRPIPDAPILFESDCPEQCTRNLKKWICTTCGEFIKIKPGFIEQLLFCACGPMRYKHNVLICHHKSHQVQNLNVEINEEQNEEEEFHPPVPYSKPTYSDIFSSDELLSSIYHRFQEIQVNRREVNDPKIFITIIELLASKNEDDIKSTLRKLQYVALDRDTQQLIHQYLSARD